MADERLGEATVRGETERIGCASRYCLTRITSDQRPFLHLPLHLNHVKNVMLFTGRGAGEVSGLALHRQPRQGNRRVDAVHAHAGTEALRACRGGCRIETCGEQWEIVEAIEVRQ